MLQEDESDPAATFPNWKEYDFVRKGTPTTSVKKRRASKALSVRLKLDGSLLMIKANGSEKKTNAAIGMGHYLAQKVIRLQPFEGL
jgi:hypothetical protein